MFDTHHLSAYEPDSLDLRRQLRSRGPNLEDLLTRDLTAAALTAAGYPIQEKTLATKASRGADPPIGSSIGERFTAGLMHSNGLEMA